MCLSLFYERYLRPEQKLLTQTVKKFLEWINKKRLSTESLSVVVAKKSSWDTSGDWSIKNDRTSAKTNPPIFAVLVHLGPYSYDIVSYYRKAVCPICLQHCQIFFII
jgi:hypothetical protein